MSVIIEGMDIPSGCLECRFFRYFNGDSGACLTLHYRQIKIDDIHERPKDCPLHPLSTPCGPVTLAEKLVPVDISKTKEPCPWCKNGSDDWGVIDKNYGQYVPDNFVNYCFHCGRKLK